MLLEKKTDLNVLKKKLKDYGIGLTKDQILEIVEDIKLIREGGKKITDEDLIAIAAGYVGKVPDEEKEVKLEEMSIISGLRITPTATAILNINGTKKVGSNIGNGAVDAALNALKSIVQFLPTGRLPVTLNIGQRESFILSMNAFQSESLMSWRVPRSSATPLAFPVPGIDE